MISHNITSNKRFIIQHAKSLCPCGQISRIFIYGECVTEVRDGERNWRGKSSKLIGRQQTNLSNRSSGVQITRDICTRCGVYLYFTRCSWIINRITDKVLKACFGCKSVRDRTEANKQHSCQNNEPYNKSYRWLFCTWPSWPLRLSTLSFSSYLWRRTQTFVETFSKLKSVSERI